MRRINLSVFLLSLLLIKNILAEDVFYRDAENSVAEIKTIVEEGGRVDWTKDIIFFDAPGKDGYYDIWSINIDGSNKQCLTCDKETLTLNHVGNPAIHPAGRYLIFQAVNPDLAVLPLILRFGAKQHTSPGAAINNNLWCMDLDNKSVWQLTDVSAGQGALHPHFSKDGKKVIWSQKVKLRSRGKRDAWGEWAIKIADFELRDGIPFLTDVKTMTPGNFQCYETHGFSPDGSKITFSAFGFEDDSKTFDCFMFDLNTDELINLTDSPNEWDEFACISPDGKKVAWVSTCGAKQKRNRKGHVIKGKWKLDLWIMNIDGTDKMRLTHFNVAGYPEYDERGIIVADFSWGNNGKTILAKVRIQSKNVMSNETVRLIKLK